METLEVRQRSVLSPTVLVLSVSICLGAHYVHSAYRGFARSTLGGLFARADDLPGPLPKGLDSKPSPIVGYHYFGDLLDSHLNVGSNGKGGYFGISYLFFYVMQNASYRTVFALFISCGITFMVLSLRKWLSIVSPGQHFQVVALHFSYPFLFALDRGQVALVMGYMISYAIGCLESRENTFSKSLNAQIVLGLGLAIKMYPILLVLSLSKLRRLTELRTLLLTIAFSVFIVGITAPDGLMHFFYQVRQDALYSTTEYFEATLNFNTSLKALIWYNLTHAIVDIKPVLSFLFDNYTLFAVGLTVLFSSIMMFFEAHRHERVLVFAILANFLPSISPVYSQVLLVSGGLVYLASGDQSISARRISSEVLIFWSILPINLPLSQGGANQIPFTVQSLITPALHTLYLLIVSGSCISNYYKHKPWLLQGQY